jgi:uncharacterized protein YndB with AHSA1/START domain
MIRPPPGGEPGTGGPSPGDRSPGALPSEGMNDAPEPAFLVIADISGYTSYLAGVELDHAQDILADLIDVVVRSVRPTFRLAKLEGDAAFAFAMGETIDGSALQDTVERTYFSFRRRLRDIGQASQCDCNACTLMPRLDLKFVVHHGPIVRQRMAGREELVGRDVIVVHRLLKNSVVESLGLPAYALYTGAVMAAAGVGDPAAGGLVEHLESYEFVGEVPGWVRDLEAAYREAEARSEVVIGPQDETWSVSFDLPAPPAVTWDWLTSPVRRPQWQPGLTAFDAASPTGRRGVGTTNHCVHGRDAVIEEVLAWRPPELLTTRMQLPVPNVPKFTYTEFLAPSASGPGTTVTMRFARPASARDRAVLDQMGDGLAESYSSRFPPLRALLEEEMARRAAEAAEEGPEPDLPVSSGRNIREPVAR